MPKEKHQDLDFIIEQLDWEKNVDPHFKEHNYLEPIVDKTRSGPGYTDRWIDYGRFDGEQLVSAKELTVEPGAKCTLKDPGASGWITVQGRGRMGKLDLQTPVMIRFGEETEDEVFITHEAATAGVEIENTGSEPLVGLRYFGPDVAQEHAGDRRLQEVGLTLPAERRATARLPTSYGRPSPRRQTAILSTQGSRCRQTMPTTIPSCTTRPGRAWSAKAPDGEPPIDLDTMLDLTAAAEVDGVKFDGFDLFLFDAAHQHRRIGRRAEAAGRQGPRAEPGDRHGRGPGLAADRRRLGDGRRRTSASSSSTRSARAAASPSELRELGVRPDGVVRIDSACGVDDWLRRSRRATRSGSPRPSARPARSPRTTASGWPPKARSAGAACTVGERMLQLLEMVDRPQTLGFQADMAHTLLYLLGYNAPEDAHPAAGFRLAATQTAFDAAYKTLTDALRPWTIDFHVAQNDATVTAPARTTRPAATAWPPIPTASSTSSSHAGYWLRDAERQADQASSATSAGTAACSPTP